MGGIYSSAANITQSEALLTRATPSRGKEPQLRFLMHERAVIFGSDTGNEV